MMVCQEGMHKYIYFRLMKIILYMSLPETYMAPENQWLEDDCCFSGMAYFQGRAVSFREVL